MVVAALVALGLRLAADDAPGAAAAPAGVSSLAAVAASSGPSSRPASSPPGGVGAPAATAGPRSAGALPARARPVPPPRHSAAERAAGLRADGTAVAVPTRGPGTFRGAEQGRPTTARAGRLVRFDLAVERGVAVDPDQAALLVARVLDDERSWRGTGAGRFTLVPYGERADVHAVIATPRTTDRLCAPLLTRGKVSCQNGARVVLNAERWVRGAAAYGRDTAAYRRYLVNHEFGHVLGRPHVGCPGRGAPAPVMMQQTKGLAGCRPNPWPSRTRG